MREALSGLFVVVVLAVSIAASALLVWLTFPGAFDPPQPKPAPVIQQPEPGHEMQLLGTTADGSRVYRVSGPKCVVPVFVVVSPSGAVAVR